MGRRIYPRRWYVSASVRDLKRLIYVNLRRILLLLLLLCLWNVIIVLIVVSISITRDERSAVRIEVPQVRPRSPTVVASKSVTRTRRKVAIRARIEVWTEGITVTILTLRLLSFLIARRRCISGLMACIDIEPNVFLMTQFFKQIWYGGCFGRAWKITP